MSFIARLKGLFRGDRLDRELDEELRSHVEMRTADNLAAGMSPEAARFDAQKRFGNTTLLKEDTRAVDIVCWLEECARDLRYALRMLQRSQGFTAVAVLTLALGIGVNTAIFSVVNTVLLRPLPYKDADRLVTVWGYNRVRGFDTNQVSPLDFADWRSQNHVFETIAASTDAVYTLTGTAEPALIIAYSFSADYFHVLGVAPLLGRTFLPEEEQPGKNHVVVLSYSFWQSRLGGDRGLVGHTIHLDGAPYTVVGIMPLGFQYPTSTELWTRSPQCLKPQTTARTVTCA